MAGPGRFSRFMNLEGPRQARKDESPEPGHGRFEALESRAEEAGGPAASPGLERFEPRQASDTLELAERRPAEESFIRCARCEVDNYLNVRCCQHCQADLATLEQQDYTARFQARLRAEAEALPVQEEPPMFQADLAQAEREQQRELASGKQLPAWLPESLAASWPRYEVLGGSRSDGFPIPAERLLARAGAMALAVLMLGGLFVPTRALFAKLAMELVLFWTARGLWRWSQERE